MKGAVAERRYGADEVYPSHCKSLRRCGAICRRTKADLSQFDLRLRIEIRIQTPQPRECGPKGVPTCAAVDLFDTSGRRNSSARWPKSSQCAIRDRDGTRPRDSPTNYTIC